MGELIGANLLCLTYTVIQIHAAKTVRSLSQQTVTFDHNSTLSIIFFSFNFFAGRSKKTPDVQKAIKFKGTAHAHLILKLVCIKKIAKIVEFC